MRRASGLCVFVWPGLIFSAQDMTAFVARNATESIGFISTEADTALTNWTLKLSKEYVSIKADVYELGP